MCILHLNSEVRQYDGFTTGRSVFGRTPKLPTGPADIPNFRDFTDPDGSPVTQTHDALVKLR